MLGSQFVNIGTTTKDINDVLANNTLPGMTAEGAFQTTLLRWDGSGYVTYGWADADDGTLNEWPEANSKWLLEDGSDIATENVAPGASFWLRTSGNGTVLTLGEVPSTVQQPVTISDEFTMLAYPLPVSISIQKIVPSATIPGMTAEGAFQTTLLVWDGSGYETYGWADADDGTINEWPEANSKWLLEDGSDISDKMLNVGQAVWFRTTGEGTVSFAE